MIKACIIALALICSHEALACSPILDIKTAAGVQSYQVEVADTIWSRAQGLMHRANMAETHGMLFLCDGETPVSFWMKNVVFPLDILFVHASGGIVKIHSNAQPGNLTPIQSEGPVIAVLEINGGVTKRAQINVGDQVLYRSLRRAEDEQCAPQ